MYCPQCGKELPPGSMVCAGCGFRSSPTSATPSAPATLEQLLAETKHAAKDLASSTAQLSKRLISKAQTAAKDPSGSAKKVAHRAAKELEAAAREIDRILRDL
jgi:cell division septum initiation protein DivIVA